VAVAHPAAAVVAVAEEAGNAQPLCDRDHSASTCLSWKLMLSGGNHEGN
jgi:hypothetical protein